MPQISKGTPFQNTFPKDTSGGMLRILSPTFLYHENILKDARVLTV